MVRVRSFLLVLTVLVGGALLVAQPADAAVNAYNYKTQYLTATPTIYNDVSCVQRRIGLTSGYYVWGFKMGASMASGRTMFLGTGAYTWKDCLSPQAGFYQHTSELTPDNTAWPVVRIVRTWTLGSSGTYQWGGYLDPQF